MAAPQQFRAIANTQFPRMFVRDAFYSLRPDLPPVVIDQLVEGYIAQVLAYRADLPADAWLP